MNKENRRIEEILVLITVILLLSLTVIILERSLPVSFQKITGKVVTRVNIIPARLDNCNFTLYQGLNLVSFFCITNMEPRDNVTNLISNLDYIFEYQEDETDSWKIYNPSLPSFVVQDLTQISRLEGYWINMSNNELFFMGGNLRVPSSVYLVPGWNLVGNPTNETKSVNQSFISIDGNFTEVRTYNTSLGTFISYVPGVGGALNQTQAYFGYWINATEYEVWIVD